MSEANKPASVWGSGWTSLAAPEQLKKIQSITLELIDSGGITGTKGAAGTFTYYTDWHDANSVGSQSLMFGEIEGASDDRHKYNSVELGNTPQFDNPRVIRKRIDLNMDNGCKWFRFAISATDRFQLRTYTMQYTYVGDRGNQTHVWEG